VGAECCSAWGAGEGGQSERRSLRPDGGMQPTLGAARCGVALAEGGRVGVLCRVVGWAGAPMGAAARDQLDSQVDQQDERQV